MKTLQQKWLKTLPVAVGMQGGTVIRLFLNQRLSSVFCFRWVAFAVRCRASLEVQSVTKITGLDVRLWKMHEILTAVLKTAGLKGMTDVMTSCTSMGHGRWCRRSQPSDQDIDCILWDPLPCSPLIPNLVHTTKSYYFKMLFNIIIPSFSTFPNCSLRYASSD